MWLWGLGESKLRSANQQAGDPQGPPGKSCVQVQRHNSFLLGRAHNVLYRGPPLIG